MVACVATCQLLRKIEFKRVELNTMMFKNKVPFDSNVINMDKMPQSSEAVADTIGYWATCAEASFGSTTTCL